MGDAFSNLVRSQAPITLHDDFTKGLKDWTTVAMRNVSKVDDPKSLALPSGPNIIHPGSLRLWNRSVSLQNYQMEFKGVLEKKSMSWAFRASDAKNYYATKIMITKPGPLPNAGLVRYVMMNGREFGPRATADPGNSGTRRHLQSPRKRSGRPFYYLSERPSDQFLERQTPAPRRSRVLLRRRRSAESRLGKPVGTR